MKLEKFNKFAWGFIPGIMIPLVTFFITWMIMSELPFFEYLSRFYHFKKLPNLISLSIIPNLLVFFIFIWTNRNHSARGVLSATFIMAFLMLAIKFF